MIIAIKNKGANQFKPPLSHSLKEKLERNKKPKE